MRQSREAKAETHQTIVTNASRLFRERGIEKTSVGDVMTAAERTHGGFYRHFDSKDALLAAALDDAFDRMVDIMMSNLEPENRTTAIARFRDFYLSMDHLRNPGKGCPAAALSGEISRSTPELKTVFGGGIRRMIDAFAHDLSGTRAQRRKQAAQQLATLVGAIMIARASDGETAELVLSSVNKA